MRHVSGSLAKHLVGATHRTLEQLVQDAAHKVTDSSRTSPSGLSAGVYLDVIDSVDVGVLELSSSGAGITVAARGLAAIQFGGAAMHTYEHDVDIDHDRQQIHQPPGLAQNVVHNDVVAR